MTDIPARMQAVVATPSGEGWCERREVDVPEPASAEVLGAVAAFAVNRGELTLLQARDDGWQPGQDVAGVVARPRPTQRAAQGHARGRDGRDGGVGAVRRGAGPSPRRVARRRSAGDGRCAPDGGHHGARRAGRWRPPLRPARAGHRLGLFAFAGHEDARLQTYFSGRHEGVAGRRLKLLLDLVAADRLHVEIGAREDWAQLGFVLDALSERTIAGKAVLRVS